MNPGWSFLLAAVGLLGVWLAGRKSWTGWAVGIVSQVLWITYGLTTGQYGFFLSAFAYGAMYARNWWLWTRTAWTPNDPVPDTEAVLS